LTLDWKLVRSDKYLLVQINEMRAAIGLLSARGEKYCNESCLIKYLEARNWNVEKSSKMLVESLKWREGTRPENIRWVIVFFFLLFSSDVSFLTWSSD
jgi:hypothetical protein